MENFYEIIKRVFILKGDKVSELLNGLSAQKIDRPQNAFLDKKGKVIVTCDQVHLNREEHLLVIEKKYVFDFMKYMSSYLPLYRVQMLPAQMYVYQTFEEEKLEASQCIWIPQKRGYIVLSEKQMKCQEGANQNRYDNNRLLYGMPRQSIDYEHPIINTLDQEQYFYSLEKGCYPGQEIVSRIYYRGRIPNQICVKEFLTKQEAQSRQATSIVYDEKNKIYRGFVWEKC